MSPIPLTTIFEPVNETYQVKKVKRFYKESRDLEVLLVVKEVKKDHCDKIFDKGGDWYEINGVVDLFPKSTNRDNCKLDSLRNSTPHPRRDV